MRKIDSLFSLYFFELLSKETKKILNLLRIRSTYIFILKWNKK